MLLAKMAVNAKKAKDDLAEAMRQTQEKFAKAAKLENKRQRQTIRRSKKTREIMRKNKAEGAKNLKDAVTAQQTATAAWASATNARIDRMNKHVAANAAQIKENAKKARKDLEVAMHSWDHKIRNFRRDSKAARSRLSAQFAAQDKATRAWANNKIKALVASTAAQFNDVETKMAQNRHEIDMALKQATMRFEAALNAQKALEAHRYAQTVRNIAAARADAARKVAKAKTEFKVGLLQLSSTVKEQVTKVNNRIDNTAGVVRSNRAAQAKVNANVNAEMSRMIKLGNKRYKKHLQNDIELQKLIQKGQAETNRKLDRMAMSFNQALASVRRQLAKDRKHAENKLKKSTGGVWAALWKNQAMQAKKNAAMAAATRRMRLDAIDQVRKTKAQFRKKIHNLGVVVRKNDAKADKKIEHLTGVVKANAAKSAKGRREIAALEEANKNELHHSIRQAIAKGEKRAQLVEKRGAKMDKDTRWLINNKLNTEISKLRDETNASVEALALQSKEARAEMKKEMLYAIRSASQVAKAALERKAIKAQAVAAGKSISRMLTDAVATVNRAQLAYADETAKAIKKSNMAVDAHARQMEANAKKVAAEIKAQTATVQKKIAAHVKQMAANTAGFSAKDKARAAAARKFLTTQLAKAEKASSAKFGAAYIKLAKDRRHASTQLGAAVAGLNDSLAKQAALADSRFAKTVKDLSTARSQAAAQVKQLRKDFATQIASVTAFTKKVE